MLLQEMYIELYLDEQFCVLRIKKTAKIQVAEFLM